MPHPGPSLGIRAGQWIHSGCSYSSRAAPVCLPRNNWTRRPQTQLEAMTASFSSALSRARTFNAPMIPHATPRAPSLGSQQSARLASGEQLKEGLLPALPHAPAPPSAAACALTSSAQSGQGRAVGAPDGSAACDLAELVLHEVVGKGKGRERAVPATWGGRGEGVALSGQCPMYCLRPPAACACAAAAVRCVILWLQAKAMAGRCCVQRSGAWNAPSRWGRRIPLQWAMLLPKHPSIQVHDSSTAVQEPAKSCACRRGGRGGCPSTQSPQA